MFDDDYKTLNHLPDRRRDDPLPDGTLVQVAVERNYSHVDGNRQRMDGYYARITEHIDREKDHLFAALGHVYLVEFIDPKHVDWNHYQMTDHMLVAVNELRAKRREVPDLPDL